MNLKLKKLGIMSVAKIYSMIGVVIGLVMGVIFALISMMGGALGAASGGENTGGVMAMMAGMGFLSIIFFPIFYGIACFIAGAVGAWYLNMVAPRVGGVQMFFDQDEGPAA